MQERNIKQAKDESAHINGRNDRLTVREVAEHHKLPLGPLRYWRHIGYVPTSFAQEGRKVFYCRSDVEDWIDGQDQ